MKTGWLRGVFWLCVFSLSVLAQNATPPKKVAQLTMDDLDNRVLAVPPSSARPVVAGEAAASPASTATSSPRAKTSPGANPILDAAWNKMAALRAGRIETTFQQANGTGTSLYYEFVAPDRIRMAGKDMEFIVIGATTYTKMPGQGWKRAPSKEDSPAPELSFKTLAQSFANSSSQTQLVGEELLRQVPTLKLKVSDKNGDSGYIWVGKTDGLIHQIEGAISAHGAAVKMVFSHFNAVPAIEPPPL